MWHLKVSLETLVVTPTQKIKICKVFFFFWISEVGFSLCIGLFIAYYPLWKIKRAIFLFDERVEIINYV